MRCYIVGCCLLFMLCGCAEPVTQYPEADKDMIKRQANLIEDEIAESLPNDFAETQMTDERYSKEDRLTMLANRILVSAKDLCGQRVVRSFLLRASPRPNAQPVITAPIFTPAAGETEKLSFGDAIWNIDNEAIGQSNAGAEQVVRMLARAARQNRLVRLTMVHANSHKEYKIAIKPVQKCAFGFSVDYADETYNAHADGKHIVFSPVTMTILPGDDELAFVISHETAHDIMRHHKKTHHNMVIGGIIGAIFDTRKKQHGPNAGEILAHDAFTPAFEREADYVGVYLMTRAGFNPDGALTAIKKMVVYAPQQLRKLTTHPPHAERYWNVEQAIAEIRIKQAAGEPLVPNLQIDEIMPSDNEDYDRDDDDDD